MDASAWGRLASQRCEEDFLIVHYCAHINAVWLVNNSLYDRIAIKRSDTVHDRAGNFKLIPAHSSAHSHHASILGANVVLCPGKNIGPEVLI